MTSSVRNEVGLLFVPVSDMQRAIDFYTRLFDLPPTECSHENRIHGLEMRGGGPAVLLDAHGPVRNSSQPLAAFWSDDIHATREFLRAAEAPIERDIEDIGSMFTLAFRDPDANLLMACERKPPPS